MRFPDAEASVELSFDCGPAGSIKRTEAVALDHLTLESVVGSVAKTTTGWATVPESVNALCLNYRGAMMSLA